LSKKWTILVATFIIVALGLALSLYFSIALSASNSDTSSNTTMLGYNPATDPSSTVLPGYDYLVYFDSSRGHIDTVVPWNSTTLAGMVHISNGTATCPLSESTQYCVNVDNVLTVLLHPGPGNRSIIDATGSPYLQQVLTSSLTLTASNPYLPFHVDLSTKQIVPGYVQ